MPFIFLSSGEEVWFRHKTPNAHFRRVETVFSQDDLARRNAASEIRRNPLDIPLNTWMDGGGCPPLSALGWPCGLPGGRIIRTVLP